MVNIIGKYYDFGKVVWNVEHGLLNLVYTRGSYRWRFIYTEFGLCVRINGKDDE